MRAYDKGYVAFSYGDFTNPYKKDTFEYKEWERGFNAAYFNNQQALKDQHHEARG
jgi:hypothetical protein